MTRQAPLTPAQCALIDALARAAAQDYLRRQAAQDKARQAERANHVPLPQHREAA